jgi:hypothetical protein
MNEVQDQFSRDYYNTNRERGAELRSSRIQARKQQETILLFFQANPSRLYSREEINRLVLPNAPYTSVQRAITNLTDDGFLDKTTHMVMGSWGKKVHTWRLRPREMLQGDLF